ncbi:MAG: hypothetical protein ACKVTZ_10920 [Bacteroidia bacterium]
MKYLIFLSFLFTLFPLLIAQNVTSDSVYEMKDPINKRQIHCLYKNRRLIDSTFYQHIPPATLFKADYERDQLVTGYYINYQIDSVWTFHNYRTRNKVVYTFFRQEEKKFRYQAYNSKNTLELMCEVDETAHTWHHLLYDEKGKILREIWAKGYQIPHVKEWQEKRGKYVEYDTWKYDMRGRLTSPYFEYFPTFLLRFPDYRGLYITKDTEDTDDEEWGEQEDASAGEQKKPKKGKPWIRLYWAGKHGISHYYWKMNSRFHLNKVVDWKVEKKDWNKLKMNYFQPKIKKTAPMPPFKTKNDTVRIDYALGYLGLQREVLIGSQLYKGDYTFDLGENVKLLELYQVQQEIIARQAMNLPQTFYAIGYPYPVEIFQDLLRANHNIDCEAVGCVDRENWRFHNQVLRAFYPVADTFFHKREKERERDKNEGFYNTDFEAPSKKDTIYHFENYYHNARAEMKDFLYQKWADVCKKDSTLEKKEGFKVRLYYQNSHLKKVKFPKIAKYDSKAHRKQVQHNRKAFKQLLFQMPCYIKHRSPRQRTAFNFW